MATDTQAPGELIYPIQAESTNRVSPAELARIVETAAQSAEWIGRVRLCAERRWYERIYHGQDYDLWVISWLPGQSTGLHDHGASSGAFIVTTGVLEELRPNQRTYISVRGEVRCFGPDYAHDVRNASDAPAISLHAYSPPLTEMNEYELNDGQLVPREGARRQVEQNSRELTPEADPASDSRVEQVLAGARARLQRMSPAEAFVAVRDANALLVDIRPAGQRALEGTIPGAMIIERNVLEWRLDPSSSARLPIANRADLQVIVFCSEGYASSLAAADLQSVGLWRATDIVGGFQAWRASGLPTETF